MHYAQLNLGRLDDSVFVELMRSVFDFHVKTVPWAVDDNKVSRQTFMRQQMSGGFIRDDSIRAVSSFLLGHLRDSSSVRHHRLVNACMDILERFMTSGVDSFSAARRLYEFELKPHDRRVQSYAASRSNVWVLTIVYDAMIEILVPGCRLTQSKLVGEVIKVESFNPRHNDDTAGSIWKVHVRVNGSNSLRFEPGIVEFKRREPGSRISRGGWARTTASSAGIMRRHKFEVT